MIANILESLAIWIQGVISAMGYAGVARMPMGKFVAYTFAGSLPWCLGLAWVGMKLGEHIDQLKPWFHRFDAVLVVAGLLAVAWFIRRQLKERQAVP